LSYSKLNIIKNVFISIGDNKLKLAEIHFGNSISEIKFISDSIEWNEIDSIEKKNYFVKKFSNDVRITQQVIDGEFNLLIPGSIDSHVHFNTPGFEEREDFAHASTATAFGGVTTVVDMPCTSIPPVTSVNSLNTKLDSLKGKSVIDYALWGGISRNDFENKLDIQKQIMELSDAGVAGFKAYLISGMPTFKDLSAEQMKIVAKYVEQAGKILGVHAEDKFLVESRRLEFQATHKNGWRQYCLSRDVLAEEKAVKDIIEIASATGVKAHIVHLSSKIALELIKDAQNKNISITSETCPHYLYFTQDDFLNPSISNYLKTAPPVKFEDDRIALWNGLVDGTLSFVVTDHAGSIPEIDKSSDNFWEVYGGIPGVEHRVPFLFSEGFLKNRITLEKTINLLSKNVANLFGIKNKGEMNVGFDSDFALINLWNNEIVSSDKMHSKGKFTPFEGVKFNATVEKTWLRGKVVADKYNKNEIKYNGEFIPVKIH
jgi:allantoinase